MSSPPIEDDASQLPLLQLAGLVVEYRSGPAGPVRAVDGVDLQVGRGEIVALVGESGCGKTTLARTVLGLQPAAAGEVLLAGRRKGGQRRSPAQLRAPATPRAPARGPGSWQQQVQLIPQDPAGSLNPRRTVYEAVAEGLRIHRTTRSSRSTERAKVIEALAQAGLRPPERFLDRYPHQLSGGQRQRVLIAGALALEPALLVADEPVSSLDASVRGEILALLLRLRDELGLTVLVITHDLGLAWNIADRLAVMYLGRLVEVGPTEEVLARPRHPYTQALLSVVPEIRHVAAVVLTGEPPDAARMPAGCRFHPRCPALASGLAAAAGVAAACARDPLPILTGAAAHEAACLLPAPST